MDAITSMLGESPNPQTRHCMSRCRPRIVSFAPLRFGAGKRHKAMTQSGYAPSVIANSCGQLTGSISIERMMAYAEDFFQGRRSRNRFGHTIFEQSAHAEQARLPADCLGRL